MTVSSDLRAALVVHPSWVSNNATLTEFCDSFNTLPDSIMDDRWDDIQGSIADGAKKAALTQEPYRDTTHEMFFMRHDQDDLMSFVYQMPHKWKRTTDVDPHLHYVAMVAPGAPQNVYFRFEYVWVDIEGTIPAVASWTTGNKTLTIEIADAFVHKKVTFGPVSPPIGAKESSCLLFTIQRMGTDLADTYNTAKAAGTAQANLALVHADCHYQSDKVGTVAEVPV